MGESKLIKLFESRKGHLDYRVKRDYVRNGIATIPCQVSDYSDVISTYSVKGYETLNPEFSDFLKESAELAPTKYPVVLELIGDCLSEEEKNTIERIIRDDFAYDLGVVEREENRHKRNFLFMFFGLIVSGIILWFTHALAEEPREVFFILFWFMGDTLCDYIFMTGYDLRRDRRLAGRLASIKVVFSDSFKEHSYSESEVQKIYSEIERDVKETIREDDRK